MDNDVVQCPQCGRRNRVPAAAKGTPRCANCHQPLPWITEAGDDDFGQIVEQSRLPVVVDLWAPWCGPCRMISPQLEKLATELAGTVKLVKVNVDESPATADTYDVRAIPNLLVMHGGRVIAQRTGAAPAHVLRQWVEQALGGTRAGTSS